MVKIVVDSGCDIPKDFETNNEIDVVPLDLRIGERQYVDDESLDLDGYIRDMNSSRETPRSAAPSPKAFLERFRGGDSVFAVTLSSKLSASYNSAMLAKELYLEDIGAKFIHVFDSLSASVGEALVALKVAEFARRNLPDNEIVDHVAKFISSMKTYFIIDKLDVLVKNGRIKPYVAALASMLSIKPVCAADAEGSIEIREKARGYNNAVKRLIDLIQKDGSDFENRILAISHVRCLSKALALKDEILSKIKFKDVIICDMKGVCTMYANKGGIVLSF